MAALFVSRSDGAEVFYSVDRTLDDVAALVRLGVETWRRSSAPPLTQPALLRVESFRTNAADTTLLDLLSIMTGAVGSIDPQGCRAFARTSSS